MGADLSNAAPAFRERAVAGIVRLLLHAVLDLARNVAAGFRLALFLPVRRWQFRPSTLQAFLLLALSLGISLAHDYAASWPDNELNPDGLVFEAAMYFLFLVSIGLIAAAEDRPERGLALAVFVLSISPTGFAVYSVLAWAAAAQGLVDRGAAAEAALALYLAWYLAAVARALGFVLHPGWARGVLLLLFYAACNVVPWFLLPGAPLWQPAEAPPSTVLTRPDDEDLLLRQAEMLDGQLALLQSQRPGVVDVYFIGVAGDATEEVFLNEAANARRVFGERFDARGRSLLLANHARTQGMLPVAAARTVAAAIDGVAKIMDPAEDVLVVFLTSHGAEDGALVLELDSRPLAPLYPRALGAALDAAGVQWRVVIVSACFSGAFVEALRGPRTLAISAARADRNSFGCGHDGDYTYFGRAFIGEELQRTDSIPAAFESARTRIDALEKSEGRVPSEPQIAVGEEIGPLLEALASDLAWRRRGSEPAAPPGFEARAGEAPRSTGG
ncbi:MAG TPA: C13 family peptidase [Gammaproteobacteria bacterium]